MCKQLNLPSDIVKEKLKFLTLKQGYSLQVPRNDHLSTDKKRGAITRMYELGPKIMINAY